MKRYAWLLIAGMALLFQNITTQSEELSHYKKLTRNVYYQTQDVISQGERFSFSEQVILKKIKFKYWTDLNQGTFLLRVVSNEGGHNVPLQEINLLDPIEINIPKSGQNEAEIELEDALEINSSQIFVIIENNNRPIYLVSDSKERKPTCSSNYDGKYFNQVIKSDHKGWTVGNLAFDITLFCDYVKANETPIFEPVDVSYVLNSGLNQSISFADLNNDEYLDFVYNGRIYLNNKKFEFLCADSSVSNLGTYQANIILDINNDGLEDMLFLSLNDSSSRKSYLYLHNHGLEFEISEITLPEFENISDIKVCDIDENGYLDFVVTQSSLDVYDTIRSLPNYLFLNAGNKQFQEIPLSNGIDKQSFGCKIFDYNDDGIDDIYIINYNANDEVWISKKDKNAEEWLQYIELEDTNVNPNYIDFSFLDFDNDGIQEQFYPLIGISNQNLQTPYVDNSGDINYLSVAGKSINYSSIASGDIDNDGDLELFCSTPCECNYSRFYTANEAGMYNIDFQSGLHNRSLGENSALIDLNNDGQLDLISFEHGSLVVFKNNHSDNNYLDLVANDSKYNNQTKYTYSVFANGRIYYSHPTNQEGLLIQRPNILHFGLEANTIIDSLVVSDKDGNIDRVISNLDINRRYNIEDFDLTENNVENGLNITVAPNPFIDQVKISFDMPIWSEVNVRITDINGALVWKRRVLCQNEGRNNLVWDAYDKNYQKVPNGTYFVNLECNSKTTVIKVIKIDN